MRKKSGFTLVELIAVIAILGILSVVLLPNIIGFTYKAKVIKAQSDAGVIVRAIDAYEAEKAQEVQSAILVSRLSGTTNDESFLTLNTLIDNDVAKNEIFGGNAAVKVIPNEFTSNGNSAAPYTLAQIKISDLREIASRQMPITANIFNGRIDKVNGIDVQY